MSSSSKAVTSSKVNSSSGRNSGSSSTSSSSSKMLRNGGTSSFFSSSRPSSNGIKVKSKDFGADEQHVVGLNNCENDNRINFQKNSKLSPSSSADSSQLSSPNIAAVAGGGSASSSSRQSFRGSSNVVVGRSAISDQQNIIYNNLNNSGGGGQHYLASSNLQPNYDNLINYPPPPTTTSTSAQIQMSTSSFTKSSTKSSSPSIGPSHRQRHQQQPQPSQTSPSHHYLQNSPTSLDRNSSVRLSLNTSATNNSSFRGSNQPPPPSIHQSQLYGQIISSNRQSNSINDEVSSNSSSSSPTGAQINWVEILEPRSRTKMFANLSSGECRWEEPKGQTILRATNPNITQWWELFDQKTQRFYYYSAKDLKTIWQKPTSPDAVVVPLAKLQILKQNTQQDPHHSQSHSHSNAAFQHKSSFDGSISSGHVTPSSPLSSPSHDLSNGRGSGGIAGGSRRYFAIRSPPSMSDAQTQTSTASAMVANKPTMVSRWTQTTNITPTHVRFGGNSRPENQKIRPAKSHNLLDPNSNRPSLHHYLLSEARFARGINHGPVQDRLYDQVTAPASSSDNNNTGNVDDFYDLVANDPGSNYYDVYDRVGPELEFDEDYEEFDEYEDEDDELSYEDEEDFSCDADDEFDVDGIEDSEEEEDDEEEEDEEEFEEDDDEGEEEEDYESEEDIVVDHTLNVAPSSGAANSSNNYENDLEFYSSTDKSKPNATTTTTRIQQNQPQLIRQSSAIITGSNKHSAQTTKISINFLKNNNNSLLGNEQQPPGGSSRMVVDPKQQQLLNDGLRMSASFTAVDFKRNAVGRSSYTPSIHHHYQQQQQMLQQNQNQPHPQQPAQQQQQQPYSNPFNTGSLRSSTGRIQSSSSGAVGVTRATTKLNSTSSNIADRINLFNQKSVTPTSGHRESPGVAGGGSSSRSSISPPPLLPSSTPLVSDSSVNLRPSRHSATSAIISQDPRSDQPRYFNSQPQQQQQQQQQLTPQGPGSIISQYHQGPSKSHSLTLISQQQQQQQQHGQGQGQSAIGPLSPTSKISNNLVNLNLSPVLAASSSSAAAKNSDNSYYYCSNNLSSVSSSGVVSTSKRNSGNLSISGRSSANSTLNNNNNSTERFQRSATTTSSNANFPSFNDSHLVMLNKTVAGGGSSSVPHSMQTQIQQQLQPTPAGKSKKSNKENKEKGKQGKVSAANPKKAKQQKSGETSPGKKGLTNKGENNNSSKKTPKVSKDTGINDNSIESFARECVARHRKGGIFSKKKTLKSMLTHTKKPLKKPMISTVSDAMLVKHSVNCFKMIQIFMGDRSVRQSPNGSIDSNPNAKRNRTTTTTNHDLPMADGFDEHRLMLDLINLCVQLVPLRDEVLVQVARQVTQNPSPDSEQRGLELMCVLFWYFTASNKLAAHLHAFLIGHRNPFTAIVRRKFEQQMHRSRNTHSHLYFRKPHSPEEVGQVLRVVRAQHVGIFGEMLTDALVPVDVLAAAAASPNAEKNCTVLRQLPWPIVMLTEALLEPRHEDREGVFRCVGDMDDVHKLKIKIDTTLSSDPYFAELIGCKRSSNPAICKLTDPHDIHVIASTLKLYFRELRDSVIPTELYLEALECAHSSQKACSLLDRLPSINRNTLCYLIRFLQVFSAPDHVQDTKMDDANLSMVWAPNVLRSMTNITNSANIYEHTRAEMSLVRTLIQHLDTNSSSAANTTNNPTTSPSAIKNSKL